MTETRWDVVVVGAGPAGASAARTLTEGGLRTLVLEKKRMPRQKICSGILSHWSVDFVHRMFGPLPREVYGSPPFLSGVSLHLPSLPSPVSLPARGPIPNIWRGPFDRFLARGSGAEVRDGCRMQSLEETPDGFVLRAEPGPPASRRKTARHRARYVVAADGMLSRSIRALLPEAFLGVPLASGMQVHYHGEVDLDPAHFHVFFHTGLGFYAWVSRKDDSIHVGVAGINRRKLPAPHARFVSLLRDRHGLRIRETGRREGMMGVLRGPQNRFVLGRRNFLAAGDAAGFVHSMGEGISCALATGHLAGQAILEAERTGGTAHEIYRRRVQPEMDLCLDQFNPLLAFLRLPLRVDPLAPFRQRSLRDVRALWHDLKSFAAQEDAGFQELGLGRALRKHTLHRLMHGRYPPPA